MALTKETVISQMTVDEHGNVSVRTSTRIFDDGVMVAETYHRKTIAADDPDDDEVAEVKAIRAAVVTPERVAAASARREAARGVSEAPVERVTRKP